MARFQSKSEGIHKDVLRGGIEGYFSNLSRGNRRILKQVSKGASKDTLARFQGGLGRML